MAGLRFRMGEHGRWTLGLAVAALAGVVIGRIIERRRMLRSAAAIALTDPLTGLANRRAWEEVLRREVARLGWSCFFGSVVGAGDATADKPAGEPVRLALAPSGIPPGEQVWFVGDTEIDMECAFNTRCVPVLLGTAAEGEGFVRFAPRWVISGDDPRFCWQPQ